jgi:hypothetical protein
MSVVEYKENYLVYPDGRIWLKRLNRFAKLHKNYKGYLRVKINDKLESVHRVVATCFIPNPLNLPEVNHLHKNGDKTNNRVENLEWSTHADNMKHSFEVLNNVHGNPKKPIRATHILSGKTYEFSSQMECGRILDLNQSNINACVRGKYKTHKGYTFEYITN